MKENFCKDACFYTLNYLPVLKHLLYVLVSSDFMHAWVSLPLKQHVLQAHLDRTAKNSHTPQFVEVIAKYFKAFVSFPLTASSPRHGSRSPRFQAHDIDNNPPRSLMDGHWQRRAHEWNWTINCKVIPFILNAKRLRPKSMLAERRERILSPRPPFKILKKREIKMKGGP